MNELVVDQLHLQADQSGSSEIALIRMLEVGQVVEEQVQLVETQHQVVEKELPNCDVTLPGLEVEPTDDVLHLTKVFVTFFLCPCTF